MMLGTRYSAEFSEFSELSMRHMEVRTVCAGGTLECPPGDATSRRKLKLPFSATAGAATMACSLRSCLPVLLMSAYSSR